VDGKNPAAVTQCLLELARVGAARGIAPPEIVHVEDDVDRAMSADAKAAEPPPPDGLSNGAAPYVAVAGDSVDQRLEALLAQHPHLTGRFERIAFGVYWMRRKSGVAKRIHMRILFDQVFVRVGGGWEDLVVFAARHP